MEKSKKPKYISQKILLKDLYRKFDRQSSDNASFDSKMGILLGFFSLYFVGILTLIIKNPTPLENPLFFVGFLIALVSVSILAIAFYPIKYRDPSSIQDFYSKEKAEKPLHKVRRHLITSYTDSYKVNQKNLNFKVNLCKTGIVTFIISLILLSFSIIHMNMNISKIYNTGGEEEEEPSYNETTKGDNEKSEPAPSYDVKELNE